MNIIVDAMGGDNAPSAVVDGCVQAVEKLDVTLTLVGREKEIQMELGKRQYSGDKINIVDATEVIEGEDDPMTAIRQKRDSSMRIALNLLKKDEGDAVVSAGNTGALIAGTTLLVKRIKGVRRVALAPIMPSDKGCFLLIDAGASSECIPAFLKQFAIMGSIYMQKIMDIKNPCVKLVNIGTEEEKGTELVVETNKQLKNVPINYQGYIEARDIPTGGADVVVCDGFTGNVILKFMEGMGIAFYGMIKEVFLKNIFSKLSAVMVKSGLKEFKKKMDYTEYGGAPILGATKPVIKAHGSSDGKAFYNAIKQAIKFAESGLIEAMTEEIKKYGTDDPEGEVADE